MSYGLMGIGSQMKSTSMQGLADAEMREEERKIKNEQLKEAYETQQKTGAMSGAASGAMMGSQIMPGWGTAIGAVAGGLIGWASAG